MRESVKEDKISTNERGKEGTNQHDKGRGIRADRRTKGQVGA